MLKHLFFCLTLCLGLFCRDLWAQTLSYSPEYHRSFSAINARARQTVLSSEFLSHLNYEIPASFAEAFFDDEASFFYQGGIVSHHLLTARIIDRWFITLKQQRPVIPVFLILSPAHFGQCADGKLRSSALPWQTGLGELFVEEKKLEALRKELNVKIDPWAMENEHGIGTLLPFIAKHYPQSKIIPLLLPSRGKLPKKERKLLQKATEQILKTERQKVFVLVSTDFSHRGNPQKTLQRDRRTLNFLQKHPPRTIPPLCNDNPIALNTLGSIENLPFLLFFYTHSWQLARKEKNNVTSYFFAFFGTEN